MNKDTVERAMNKLALGRSYVCSRADYYASILYEMVIEIVDAPNITMGITRGLVLYVNGDWLLNDPEMSTDEVVGACLVHECEHPLRDMSRLEVLPNKELANIAGDEAINCNLREEGWTLPEWVVYPEKFGHPSGLTLEQYYELLSQQLQNEQKSVAQLMTQTKAGNESGAGGSSGKSSKSDDGDDGDGGGNADKGSGWQPKIGAGGCGGAAGNAVDSNLEEALDAAYGKSEVEIEVARQAVIDALEAAQGRGDLPGRFKELIKRRKQKPEVNWRSILKHVLQRSMQKVSGSSDYSMMRPSISSQLAGYIGPGLVDNQLNVIIVEDTSGSMGAPQLLQARNEAYNLMRKAGIEEAVHLQVDTKVQADRRVRLKKLPQLDYQGRGGTDFVSVFDYVKRKHPRVNLLVYFTDGDGQAPSKAPKGFEVVWCIVRTPYARRPAWWGTVVVCDKSQKLRDPY